MKLSVEVKELNTASGRGNLSRRLVLTGERWDKLDLCAHGQQLRWHCADCEQYFRVREAPKQRKR